MKEWEVVSQMAVGFWRDWEFVLGRRGCTLCSSLP